MATTVIVIICAAILFLYILRIGGYSFAIRKESNKVESGTLSEEISVTLLVPFRNEAAYLAGLIMNIQAQDYPPDSFEVIFIDDHSDDDSVNIIKRNAGDLVPMRIIHLPDDTSGKKAAISLGVEEARGERIIQTDADCELFPEFISEHVRAIQNNNEAFVAGPVLLRESAGLWSNIESLEFMSLTGSTMGSFLSGRAVMCNGANMSYSKEFYQRNQSELSKINSPSGDDIFLLARAKEEKIDLKYLLTEGSAVTTNACGSPLAFIQQRARWGSKARYYKDFDMIFLALVTFLANISILGFLVFGFLDPFGFFLFGVFLLLKSIADLLLLIQTTRHFNKGRLMRYFPFVAVFYSFYLVVAGILSLVSGYRWKGRRFRRA